MCRSTLNDAGKYSSCSLTSWPIRSRSSPQAGHGFSDSSRIVLDVDPRQMVRQRATAVLVPLRRAASGKFFVRFLGDARLVQRHLVDLQAEQQELPGIEAFVPRAVKPPQNKAVVSLMALATAA